ncbi:MAG: hypothetical protein JWO20_1354 [Candidatus Angelobacter sp.]|jgi:hypothetical protein|nr:hypothetical protein [Candidatus Angelobacter sp.]
MGEEMIAKNYLEDSIKMFRQYKKLAEKAIAQLPDPDRDLFFTPDKESNSIAITMKHMAGNMRSRWRDFLTSDGEKPDRNRDSEFEIATEENRETILRIWEEGWACVFNALDPLKPEDLSRTVLIRHEPHTVLQAINRQLAHYPYHIGQIVYLARHIAEKNWTSLSVPRGQSDAFNAKMVEKHKK